MSPINYPALTGITDGELLSPQGMLRFAVEWARLAPSGHNRQPWRFRLGPNYVDLLPDRARVLPILDPEERELTMSCGVALFYLSLALRYSNCCDVVEMPAGSPTSDWLARVHCGEPMQRSAEDVQLFQAIPRRHTNRLTFLPRDVPEALPARFLQAASQEGGRLQVIDRGATRAAVIRLIGEGVHALAGSVEFRQEMSEWFHPLREGDTDGIAHLSREVGELLTHSGPLVSSVDGGALLARQETLFASEAPLLAVLGTPGDTPEDWLVAGQALARILLTAADNGINVTYLNQPIQVERLRPRLREAVGMEAQPQLLLAMGYAPAVSPAPRRPIEEILVRTPANASSSSSPTA